MSIADVSVDEGDAGTGYAAVVVSLSEPRPRQPVTVNYTTQNGTATGGSDFTAASGKVTFAVGEMSKTIMIPITGDSVVEPTEQFRVNLNTAKQAKIGDGQAIVTIVDDDPRVSVQDLSANEGHSGTTQFNVTVNLTNAYSQPVTVNYATADGSAVAGSDYQAASGSVTFAAGQTSKTIPVSVIGDRVGESDKYFLVNLEAGSNANLLDSQAIVTIVDDEPRISISGVSALEGNSGNTPFVFTVSLAAEYDQTVTVDFATADYTAIAGTDYVAASGTVTFIAGDTSETVTVQGIGNTTPEAEKYFYVNLSGASANAVIASSYAYGSISDDDGYVDPYYDYGYYDYGGYYYYDYYGYGYY
jgi:hypothetical protein